MIKHMFFKQRKNIWNIGCLCILMTTAHSVTWSQKKINWDNFNNRTNWRANRLELQFGICATQCTGDLGGAGGKGTDYSTKDINWEATEKGVQAGFKYRFSSYLATKSEFSYFELSGNDRYTSNPLRNDRNLNFKSNNFEFSQRLEFIFLAQEFNGSFYRLTERARRKKSNFQLYTFWGMGLSYFNPKAIYNGTWVELRPLKTEGQIKPYSNTTFIMPFGFGMRLGIAKQLRLGIEANYIKTSTDYLDDVSTFYPDPSLLSSQAAVYLSNQSQALPGTKRGDLNQKDAYYRLSLSLIFNLKNR